MSSDPISCFKMKSFETASKTAHYPRVFTCIAMNRRNYNMQYGTLETVFMLLHWEFGQLLSRVGISLFKKIRVGHVCSK